MKDNVLFVDVRLLLTVAIVIIVVLEWSLS